MKPNRVWIVEQHNKRRWIQHSFSHCNKTDGLKDLKRCRMMYPELELRLTAYVAKEDK
jgi:hypothetical protein